MDTHATSHPDIEHIPSCISARLPGEEETAPDMGELETGERLLSSTPKSILRRRGALLAGVGVAAIVIAGGVLLVSPYGKGNSALNVQATVNGAAPNAAYSAQSTLHPLLAPSAALAKISVPPTQPVPRNTWSPQPRDSEVAELLSLHSDSGDKLHADRGSGSNVQRHPAAVAGRPAAMSVSQNATVPAGYVPREPGASGASQTPVSTYPSPEPPVTIAAAPGRDATAQIIASLARAQPAAQAPLFATQTVTAPVVQQQPDAVPASRAAAQDIPAAAPQPDALAVATNLRAGPMTTHEQVQVLNLVTEMAAVVKNLHKQQAQLRSDSAKSSTDVAARLADFERRLALAEARSGVAAADDATGSAPVPAPVEPASDHTATSLRPIPILATRPIALVPASASGGVPKLYRVQAASPGLALLAQVDRGGGDGAQMQVVVGDNVPEYGRVKSIAQKGTAWVVTTEHGAIQ